MTADHQPPPEPAASPDRPCAATRDFAHLAKQLTVWSSRGIVSAAIIVAGLAFGRQVLQWWGVDRDPSPSPPSQSLALGALGDPAQEHRLEFGGSDWSLSRATVRASDAKLLAELEARCAAVIASSPVPATEPGPSELALLSRVAATKPACEEAGQWQLFALDSAFPMALGTRWVASTDRPPAEWVAKTRRRVVTWGLAVPAGGDVWTVYTFHTASLRRDDAAIASDLPIPPGGRKTLAIRAADGGAVVAFQGPDRPGQWGEFFDAWLAAHGWKATSPWQHRQTSQSLRAVCETGDSLDVLLSSQGTGEMTGLMLLTPRPPQRNE
jgi:hypothetical protein